MKVDKAAAKRGRAHTRYRKKDGTIVPGVTTVLHVLNKPALGRWHNQMGLQGIDTTKYVDALAEAGTIAHEMICSHNKGEEWTNSGEHSQDLVDLASNSFRKYLSWAKGHNIIPVHNELELVSEDGFGGCIDFYGMIDGHAVLLDFKTSKAIYPEHIYQVAAYRRLLAENGYSVEAVGILQIGRDENEGFSERTITDTSREWEIFWHCLALYQLKVGKWEGK